MMKKILIAPLVLVLCSCANNQLKTSDAQIQAPFITQPAPPPKAALVTLELPNGKAKPHSVVKLANKPLFGDKILSADKESIKPEGWLPRIARYIKKGIASWYGPGFHGRQTANGEIFNMYEMTAAHKTLPIPSYAEVTNLSNNKTVVVRINDRGPYVGNRLLDLSYAAAKKLGIQGKGTGKVEIKAITPLQALPHIQKTAEIEHKNVFFQVGSFGSQSKAMRLQGKIAANNLPSPTILTSKHKKKTQYKVQMGPIKSKETAESLTYQLAKIGIKDPQIVVASR
ncbi:hypothetical protein MCAMS1_02108 [biofilm metagenome]